METQKLRVWKQSTDENTGSMTKEFDRADFIMKSFIIRPLCVLLSAIKSKRMIRDATSGKQMRNMDKILIEESHGERSHGSPRRKAPLILILRT
jgi:hypothetical protein